MARAKNIETLDRQLEQLKEKEKQLKAQKQSLIAREKQKERKARNHALIVMGGFVESACGGDWRTIDFEKLDEMLHKYSGNYRKVSTEKTRTAKEANEALRAYEQEKRNRTEALKKETKELTQKVLS